MPKRSSGRAAVPNRALNHAAAVSQQDGTHSFFRGGVCTCTNPNQTKLKKTTTVIILSTCIITVVPDTFPFLLLRCCAPTEEDCCKIRSFVVSVPTFSDVDCAPTFVSPASSDRGGPPSVGPSQCDSIAHPSMFMLGQCAITHSYVFSYGIFSYGFCSLPGGPPTSPAGPPPPRQAAAAPSAPAGRR